MWWCACDVLTSSLNMLISCEILKTFIFFIIIKCLFVDTWYRTKRDLVSEWRNTVYKYKHTHTQSSPITARVVAQSSARKTPIIQLCTWTALQYGSLCESDIFYYQHPNAFLHLVMNHLYFLILICWDIFKFKESVHQRFPFAHSYANNLGLI